ncbi:MAG: branched-chain amino acid ABC transporter substrate-binding protein [Chloroflexi bacterium]|nr:branched-chain amino acid ABC transporter substrate-binding protein [Chloroflexota bacterium]
MYSKSFCSLFTLLLLASLVLTGCGTAATPIPIPTLTPIQPTSTPVPTETPVPTPTNTPFVPKATFKIAVHVPMTGGMSMSGMDIVHASELAVAQLSMPLELMGYDVELASYDDMGDLDATIKNAKNIVNDAGILCGVGHFNSRLTIQASEVYHQAGLAFISPSSTNAEVTGRGYPEINRVVGRDDGQGAAGAQFARDFKFNSIYVLYNKAPYEQQNADGFKREANKLGLPIVGELPTEKMDNFEETINDILGKNTDLVYFAGLASQVGNFIKEARSLGYTGALLGTDALSSPEILDFAGPFAIDGGGLYYTMIGANLASMPNGAQFAKDYQLQFSADPQMYAPYAYDATGICLKAIEEASKAKGGEIPTRAEVVSAVHALVDYPGISGTYTFDSNGDPTTATYQVFQVSTIDPGKWGENPVVISYEMAPPEK